jgi:hypothetical protein
MAQKSNKKTVPAKRERLVYCGPNLPGGRLPAFTVFAGGIPGNVQAIIAECADVRGLIVPVDRLAVVRARVSDRTTAEAALYAAVRKHFNV